MSPRPGVDVALLDTPGAVSAPSDTGVAFVVGITERGPIVPKLVNSLSDYVNTYGARVTYGQLYDWLDVFFREGGNAAYISRVVGPAATSGSLNLLDSGAGVSLIATANGPGSWSSSYKVQVTAGGGSGTYQIRVLDSTNAVLEISPDLTTQQDAVNWSQGSNYIRITLGATALVPAVVAATALSAGNDDRGNITDTHWQTALDRFTADYGPGQVCEPGRTTSTAYSQLTGHAANNNRVAILDAPDTGTSATLTSSAGAVTSRFAALFAPWIVVPGVTTGTTRSVPPSALICGLIARNDPALGTNRPSAGPAGVSKYATGLTQAAWDDTTRNTLNAAGVNVIRNMKGSIKVYGWRSQADAVNDTNWLAFSNSRLFMTLSAELNAVAENYVFSEIDGQNGITVNGLHDALAGVMMEHFKANELFGDSADQAFVVDTGPSVNTLTRIQNLELHAIVSVKMAPFAEWVQIQVVKRQVTEAVA